MTPRRALGRVRGALVWVARRWPWVLLLLVSALLHLWGLGGRSFHHDEAVHAKLSFDLAERGVYRYDPTYHGPLLYDLTAASFVLFGDSDTTARLPIALCGIALVAVGWRLRRRWGEGPALFTALLATVSPLLLFYGRFLRMDLLELVTASFALLAFAGALRRRRGAWTALGVWTGLAFATKENAYVTAALVVVAALVVALQRGPVSSIRRAVGWLVEQANGVTTAVGVFVLVTIPLYTVGFSHPEDWVFPVRAIAYWWKQHSVERVGGPWWFHLPRLAQYELLPLVAATVWVLRRRRRLRPIELFLYTFGLASIAMYCYLGEKVPWLGVHQVWPFLPLAGAQLARTFGPRGRWWSRTLATAGLVATVVVALTASFVLDEISPRRPRVESLHFVQTTPELHAVAEEGLRLDAGSGGTVAAVEGEGVWPLTWYWRGLPVWWSAPPAGTRPPLVVCDPAREREVRAGLGPGYTRERVPLRAWWLMYSQRPTPAEVVRYELTRRPWGSIGSTDVIVLRRSGEARAEVRTVESPAPLVAALGVTRAEVIGEGWLEEVRGVSVADGRVAAADPALSELAVLARDGRLIENVSAVGLDQPEAVAWLDGQRLLVADTWRHRLLVADLSSGATSVLAAPAGGWYGPRAVAVAADGRVVAADTGHRRLVFYDDRLELDHLVEAGDVAGGLVEPGGVVWLGRDAVLVCDTGQRRLVVLGLDGTLLREVDLPDAWSDFYSRPQVAALAPQRWLVSDTPAAALWLVEGGVARRLAFDHEGLVPTGVAWDAATGTLALGDLGGRIWLMEVGND